MSPRTSKHRRLRSLVALVVVSLVGGGLFHQPAAASDPPDPRWHDLDRRVRPPAASDSMLVYDEARHELLLFGGVGNDGPVGTWARRNETWVQLHPATEPSPRYGATMVYDSAREEVVLFGGWGAAPTGGGNRTNNETWIWDGTDWRQAETPQAPPARAFAGAGFDRARGELVLFGGITGDGTGNSTMFNDTWTWDGARWDEMTPSTSPGRRHSVGSAFDAARGELVIFGGSRDLSSFPSDPCEIRDPIANSCVVNIPSNEPRPSSVLDETWIWDGTDWTQRTPERVPRERMNPKMTYDPARDVVLLFGGVHPSGGASTDTWVWNGSEWTELDPQHHPSHRFGIALAGDPDSGRVFAFGGHQVTNYARDTWGWDGTDWSLLDQPPTPEPRYFPAFAYDSQRGEAVLFGGDGHRRHADTWVYNDGWQKREPATSPPALTGAAAAYDHSRDQVVMFGGHSAGRDSAETWLWDGTDWRQGTPPASPAARRDATMAYDAARDQVVLFGGAHYRTSDECPIVCDPVAEFGDTWVWNGANWTEKQPATSPPPLTNTTMTYDPERGEIVLFGGLRDNEFSGETWTWDGESWSLEQPSTTPTARSDAAMTYDPLLGRVVMFSGLRSGSTAPDVWLWDGSDWTEVFPPPGPRARRGAGFAFVPELGGSLLFGGNGGGPRDDTWLLDLAGVAIGKPSLRFTESSAVVGQYSDVTLFEARLTDGNGMPIENEEISFELAGIGSSRSFQAVTDAEGLARVRPVLTEQPGPYVLGVRYASSGPVEASDTVDFVVEKEDSDIEMTIQGKGSGRHLRARLTDLDAPSNGIAEATIEFFADSERIGSAVTDESGVATFKPPPRYLNGRHDLEASFSGDDYYETSTTKQPG